MRESERGGGLTSIYVHCLGLIQTMRSTLVLAGVVAVAVAVVVQVCTQSRGAANGPLLLPGSPRASHTQNDN